MRSGARNRNERVIICVLVGMLLLLLVLFSGVIMQNYRKYKQFKVREATFQSELAQVRNEFARKEAYVAKLLEDTEFLERVVRERLGYARPGELLFHFSDEDEKARSEW